MTWEERNYYYQVTIDGDQVNYTDDVSQTEGLDQLATVVEFELIDEPSPRPAFGDDITVVQIDRSTDVDNAKYQFAGTIREFDGDSATEVLIIRCVGILDDLNTARITTDLNLTGMTDGEAVEAILTASGIPFDHADIADFGYVLGAEVPIYWRIGQTGAALIGAIDDVFGMKTLEVGNGRVVRFRYDLAPDVGDAYRLYTRGTDADVENVHRTYGNRSLRQSYWDVQGASYTCGDSCNCQVWANAVGSNPRKRSRVNAGEAPPYQSDIIQDEDLAAWVAERLMRWYNRTPSSVQVTTSNDVSVHPGTVISISDDTYQIDHSTITAYTVLTVERHGDEMTLTCEGGAAGSTGTITTGVNKRCNETDFDLDLPNIDFDPIDVSFPPFEIAFDFDFDLSFGWTEYGGDSESGGGYEIGVPTPGVWEDDPDNPDDFTIVLNNLDGAPGSNAGAKTTVATAIPEFSAGVPKSFRITFTWELDGALNGIEMFGEDVNDPANVYFWHPFFGNSTGCYFMTGAAYNGINADTDLDFGAVTIPATSDMEIEWNRLTSEWTVTRDGSPQTTTASDPLCTGPCRFFVIAGGGPGNANCHDFEITVLE